MLADRAAISAGFNFCRNAMKLRLTRARSIMPHVEGNGTAETVEVPNTVPESGKPQISPPHVGEKYEPTLELPKEPLNKAPPPAG